VGEGSTIVAIVDTSICAVAPHGPARSSPPVATKVARAATYIYAFSGETFDEPSIGRYMASAEFFGRDS
jgi:hypothetical protein